MPARKILVVDDTPLFCELESIFLARTGRVLSASSGAEALALAHREQPDVMVVDLDMPGLTGDEVCREVKSDALLGQTPVILVTDGNHPEDRARAVRAGADDVLAKPLNRIALIQAVSRFVRSSERRALARVDLGSPVRLRHEDRDLWGTCRNLSRGGMFVEAVDAPAAAEVQVHFELPDAQAPIEPTAVVVWRRVPAGGRAGGLGLRFLSIDRDGAQRIDDFVYEHVAAVCEPGQARSYVPR